MDANVQEKNKAIAVEAFDTLFNKRDFARAERFWSPDYIQHSPHVPPGRQALFDMIKGAPASMRYEPGLVIAEGDYVVMHGRFSGAGGPTNSIVVDIVRMVDGLLVEHWDVMQDEASREEAVSGRPMFGDMFPA